MIADIEEENIVTKEKSQKFYINGIVICSIIFIAMLIFTPPFIGKVKYNKAYCQTFLNDFEQNAFIVKGWDTRANKSFVSFEKTYIPNQTIEEPEVIPERAYQCCQPRPNDLMVCNNTPDYIPPDLKTKYKYLFS